jgi:hypothetical protein
MDRDCKEMSRLRRFVLLHHTGHPSRLDHYDLLLELRLGEDSEALDLLAFSTVKNSVPLGKEELFRLLEIHRRFYLSHTGRLPGAAMRGKVRQVDEGTVEFISNVDEASLSTMRSLLITLSGRVLSGPFAFRRVATEAETLFSFKHLQKAEVESSAQIKE